MPLMVTIQPWSLAMMQVVCIGQIHVLFIWFFVGFIRRTYVTDKLKKTLKAICNSINVKTGMGFIVSIHQVCD